MVAACSKLIFSATLTRDPGKLAMLRIRDPQVYIIGGETGSDESSATKSSITGTPASTDGKEFTVPRTLTERLVPIKSISVKPLRLMQLISLHQGHSKGIEDSSMKTHVLVFVNSNESAARLARLLTLLDEEVFHLGLVYQRCSSEQPAAVRRRVLRAFAATGTSTQTSSEEGPINVLVCTDLVARGIDISAVRNVINYDIPRGPVTTCTVWVVLRVQVKQVLRGHLQLTAVTTAVSGVASRIIFSVRARKRCQDRALIQMAMWP